MKKIIFSLLMLFLSVDLYAHVADSPEQNNFNRISIITPTGWNLRIEKDGSGIYGCRSTGLDSVKFPANTFSFKSVLKNLKPGLLKKGSIKQDYSVSLFSPNRPYLVSSYSADKNLIETMFNQARIHVVTDELVRQWQLKAPCGTKSSYIYKPDFHNIKEAIKYVKKEENLLSYKTRFSNLNSFSIVLPSGEKIGDWTVNEIFMSALYPFGREAVPYLLDMLNNKHEYIRLGAEMTLKKIFDNSVANYNYYEPRRARKKGIAAWRKLTKFKK